MTTAQSWMCVGSTLGRVWSGWVGSNCVGLCGSPWMIQKVTLNLIVKFTLRPSELLFLFMFEIRCFVRWQMSRLVSDFVPVYLRHWLSAAPDCLPSVIELFRSPLLASGTVCLILSLSQSGVCTFCSCLPSQLVKTHLLNISYPFPLWLYSARAVMLSCFGHNNRSSFLTYLPEIKISLSLMWWTVIHPEISVPTIN